MKQEVRHFLGMSFAFLIAFVLFTLAVYYVDVKPIGPYDSEVGLATLNRAVHDAIGQHDAAYTLSKLIGYLCFAICGFFAVIGAMQLLTTKKLSSVDGDIRALGLIYVITAAVYVLFEILIINYRPIVRDEGLEASYPSSHTMVILVVLGTLAVFLQRKIRVTLIRSIVVIVTDIVAIIGVVARLISGVHWLTDILGSIILSITLIMLYCAFVCLCSKTKLKRSRKKRKVKA
ncbi:MAG: phosphatase PAP2 family protein [Lachnospiraceae bacterium]|nr:phosphatase PAP2 family protein [Lachnospiraceae bacterium]